MFRFFLLFSWKSSFRQEYARVPQLQQIFIFMFPLALEAVEVTAMSRPKNQNWLQSLCKMESSQAGF
jgi:hypothetical protein